MCIRDSYNTSSFGVAVEATLVKEYDLEIDGVCIHIKQYQVSDSTETVSYTHLFEFPQSHRRNMCE